MADLNVNTSESIFLHEDAGNALIKNSDFENAPTFVAAQTSGPGWIDGTATGSVTNDTFGWAMSSPTGSASAQFDSSVSHSGTYSMRISTLATGSRLDIANLEGATTLNAIRQYCIPITGGAAYTLSFWMKTNFTSGSSSDGAFIRLVEYNTSGVQVGGNIDGTKVQTTQDWTQRTFSRTAGATSAFLLIGPKIVGNTGTSTLIMDAWLDDMIFQTTPPHTNVSAVLGPLVTAGVQNVSGPKIWS